MPTDLIVSAGFRAQVRSLVGGLRSHKQRCLKKHNRNQSSRPGPDSACAHLQGLQGSCAGGFPGVVSVRKVPICPRVAGSRAVGPGFLPGPPGPGLCVSGHELSGPSSAQEPLFLGQPPPAALGRGPAVPGSSW